MALENDFLPFAAGPGANVIAQQTYAALSALSSGFQAGIASSAQLNKVWRQASIMATVLAQFIVDHSGQPAIDDGTTATLEANLLLAIQSIAQQDNNYAADAGAANAYVVTLTPAPAALNAGLIVRFKAANANTGAATLNVNGLGAKNIVHRDGSALLSGEIVTGAICEAIYDGTQFILYGVGFSQQQGDVRYALQSAFVNSKATNGYQKLPNGLILQWGSGSIASTTAAQTLTIPFPIAFPNACLSVNLSHNGNTGSGSAGERMSVEGISSLTGFNSVYSSTASITLNYFWMAIGY